MVVYLLLLLFDTLVSFVFTLIPVVETPVWLVTNLPKILTTIYSFNLYLPVAEAVVAVSFCVLFTLQYKVVKVVLNKVGINLNS